MFETHVCPGLHGWCPVCDSPIDPDDEIFAIAGGSAIRTDSSFWVFTGTDECNDMPLLFHRRCAAKGVNELFRRVPAVPDEERPDLHLRN